MGLLDKVFGRGKKSARAQAGKSDDACLHTTLAPRWDSVADIGILDRAVGYTCDTCHQSFTREEGDELKRTESERLRAALGTPES